MIALGTGVWSIVEKRSMDEKEGLFDITSEAFFRSFFSSQTWWSYSSIVCILPRAKLSCFLHLVWSFSNDCFIYYSLKLAMEPTNILLYIYQMAGRLIINYKHSTILNLCAIFWVFFQERKDLRSWNALCQEDRSLNASRKPTSPVVVAQPTGRLSKKSFASSSLAGVL